MASLEELVPEGVSDAPAEVEARATQDETVDVEAEATVSEDVAADALKAVEAQLSEQESPAAASHETTAAPSVAKPEGNVRLKKVAHHEESPATYEDVAAFSVESTQARMDLEEIMRTAPEGFVEAQSEYTVLQRLFRKIDPLISGDWKEDPSVALLQVQNGLQRITENLQTLHHKVTQQKEKLAKSFGDAGTQEVLEATLGDLRKKTFDTEEKPKKNGWWNANQLFSEDLEDEGLNAVPGPREKKEEVVEPVQELSEITKKEIAQMREQIDRITATTNQRRKSVDLSHADAKASSEGYAHSRSVLLQMQNELKRMESAGVEVPIERMDQLRTQLAEALWDMKREFSGGESEQKRIEGSREHLAALVSEHPAIQETEVYAQVTQLLEEFTQEGTEKTREKMDAFTEGMQQLRALGVQHEIAAKQAEVEKEEPLVLTEDQHSAPEDSVVIETEESLAKPPASEEKAAAQTEAAESIEKEPAERLLGFDLPTAGKHSRFGALAFKEGVLHALDRVPDIDVNQKLRAQFDDVLRILGYIPEATGLREKDVAELQRLAREIAMPESLLQKKPSSVEAMRAETERKLQERLPALEGKKGGLKRKIALGMSTVQGLLAQKMKRSSSSSVKT